MVGAWWRAAGSSLHLKLSAVIVAVTVGMVALLSAAFVRAQMADLEAGLLLRARTYGRLVCQEVSSAVPHGDRQTARQAFAAVAVDPAVRGLALYDASGRLLELHGALDHPPPTWLPVRQLTVTRQRRVVQVVAPVESAAGAGGTLVLELSSAEVAAGRRRTVTLAVTWGLAAVLVGLLAAWVLGRSFARRLQRLARVAMAVAGGDLDQGPVVDPSRDEIGRLSTACNAMWARIRPLIAEIKDTANLETQRLEALVAERTAELNHRGAQMRLVLDNVEQGLVTVNAAGQVSGERSRILERWFGAPLPEDTLWGWILAHDLQRQQWFAVCWQSLQENSLPMEVSLAQLPRRIDRGEYSLELQYKPVVTATALDRVLVVVSDITAREERARAEQDQRDFAAVVERFYRDRTAMLQFFEEAQVLVGIAVDDTMPRDEAARALHTLKGTSGAMDLGRLAATCDLLEEQMGENDGQLVDDGRRRLLGAWISIRRRFGLLLDAGASRRREVDEADLQALATAIDHGAPSAELSHLARLCRYDPIERRLAGLAEQAERLAGRLGKLPLAVTIDGAGVRLPPRALGEFWSACIHVIRNAVDHGLETRDERRAAGKPDQGRLTLTARLDGATLEVAIRDLGRGIDWETIRVRARAAGRPAETEADLVEALFASGITTRQQASDISGRGVGMDAARAACLRTGGTMTLTSTPGQGTTIVFRWLAAPLAAIQGPRAPGGVEAPMPAVESARAIRLDPAGAGAAPRVTR
jgi:HAMP domain-containing protein/HPt (histidine-containing phosphotransfer) domain-containing protein